MSAAIVLFTGAMVLVVASFVSHDDTKLFLQCVGTAVGLIGLIGWCLAFRESAYWEGKTRDAGSKN